MTRVVVAGAIANKPGRPGEAWVRTSWFDGLRRLGCETWFVEEVSRRAWAQQTDGALAWFDAVAADAGIASSAVVLDADTGELLRGSDAAWEAVRTDVDLLVNVSGHARDERVLGAARCRAYVDIDPAYTQIWHDQGAELGLARHDRHFSVGLNVGLSSCPTPTAGFRWVPTPPPVVLDQWPDTPLPPGPPRFTTVAAWRGFGTLTHAGATYGPKAHGFRRFLELPRLSDVTLEVALAIDAADEADRERLVAAGWNVLPAATAAGSMQQFGDYIRGSLGELSVAQPAYVALQTGWISDRTARYLASGRPAIVQDTGIGSWLADGLGLQCFDTAEEAAHSLKVVAADPEPAAAAARAFAERHLDSDVVLGRVLEHCGLG